MQYNCFLGLHESTRTFLKERDFPIRKGTATFSKPCLGSFPKVKPFLCTVQYIWDMLSCTVKRATQFSRSNRSTRLLRDHLLLPN